MPSLSGCHNDLRTPPFSSGGGRVDEIQRLFISADLGKPRVTYVGGGPASGLGALVEVRGEEVALVWRGTVHELIDFAPLAHRWMQCFPQRFCFR